MGVDVSVIVIVDLDLIVDALALDLPGVVALVLDRSVLDTFAHDQSRMPLQPFEQDVPLHPAVIQLERHGRVGRRHNRQRHGQRSAADEAVL